VAADTQQVDSREQAFAEESMKQLNFLTLPPLGFSGPHVDQQGTGPGAAVLVSYRKGPMTIGIRLVRGHAGDDYVALAGSVDGRDGDSHHYEFQRDKARTDRQLLRAVTKNARPLRATMPSA
jgi:hypothetical protein